RPVLEAIKRLDGAANKTVMVGDSENDVNAGRRAGTITCAACYGFRTAEQMRKTFPDVMVERFDQLKDNFC
ncbi:MAG TPA: HAD hydrolase-like protein, partial [Blastocatellia bacterium]|nr:HAD hydrolase-like protein [Blastocatellia bacterium]